MITTKSLTNGKARFTFHGIETRVLEQMEPDELVQELERVERDIRKHNQVIASKPEWFARLPDVQRARNTLYSERRRINRALDEHARKLLNTAPFPLGAEVEP
jgi:hypothetical protein